MFNRIIAVVLVCSSACAGATEKFTFRMVWTDEAKECLYIRSDNAPATNETLVLSLAMRDDKTDSREVWRAESPLKAGEKQETGFDIRALPPGTYRLHYAVRDGMGRGIVDDHTYYYKPDGRPPWEGTTRGIEDTVPAPWTRPVWKDDGFSCWNREIRFGGDGLVSSIRSGGQELLAGPVLLSVGGKPLRFAVSKVDRKVSEADYTLVSADGSATVTAHAEFDGYVWFEHPYRDGRSYDMTVSVKRDLVEFFDPMYDPTSTVVFAECPTGRCDSFNPFDRPFWWTGSATIGLMGGTEGYRLSGKYQHRGDYVVSWSPERVSVTMKLKGTDGFYLQPTPARPRDDELAALPFKKYVAWTGHVERFYECKLPDGIPDAKIAPFRDQVRAGTRVFYYCASNGMSPMSPWWGRYGKAWSVDGDPQRGYWTVMRDDREYRESAVWTTTCLGDRGNLDWKIWGIAWFLDDPKMEAKDLYFDLADPSQCRNPAHKHNSWTLRATRELHKRVRRMVLAKDPSARLLGHGQLRRGPWDVFFDRLVMGEVLDKPVRASGYTYYDVLTPELMRSRYASRTTETIVDMLPQIERAHTKKDLASYNPRDPATERAFRHAVAYFKIHGLNVRPSDGTQCDLPDKVVASFGAKTVHKAYYHADTPVTVDDPSPRLLYAIYSAPGRSLLIVLNDTDAERRARIGVRGLSGVGTDIFSRAEFDFADGNCELVLPPREARFIRFANPKEN